MTVLEFWSDYGPGPLWADGKAVDLAALPIERDLKARITAWNAEYSEDKVPIDGPGDEAWLSRGRRLLSEVRAVLHDQYEVVVTEPWWD